MGNVSDGNPTVGGGFLWPGTVPASASYPIDTGTIPFYKFNRPTVLCGMEATCVGPATGLAVTCTVSRKRSGGTALALTGYNLQILPDTINRAYGYTYDFQRDDEIYVEIQYITTGMKDVSIRLYAF
jgi:hypothetical protein